jgi:hypothetical protein
LVTLLASQGSWQHSWNLHLTLSQPAYSAVVATPSPTPTPSVNGSAAAVVSSSSMVAAISTFIS